MGDPRPVLWDGGEAGALMRSLDWSHSPLGQPADWPQPLRSVVSLMLGSKFPMFVAWGPELGFLYNDPYAEFDELDENGEDFADRAMRDAIAAAREAFPEDFD